MKEAAKSLFDSIDTFKDIDRLILEGEAESLFLECKAPEQPRLGKDLQATLAKAISGFSNTNGGVLIWGVSTLKKAKSGLDILTQIEPLGRCKGFSDEIANRIPTLSVPAISNFENKIIKKKKVDTKGVILTYIPQKKGDPIQSVKDEHFWYRSGDDFVITPYQMLKRLFAATESPDLYSHFAKNIVKKEANNFWSIPITVGNASSAIAESIHIQIIIENAEACAITQPGHFRDESNINPGRTIYSYQSNNVIHRGLNVVIGSFKIKMKPRKSMIVLQINLFANKMRAKTQTFKIRLHKNKFITKLIKEDYLY